MAAAAAAAEKVPVDDGAPPLPVAAMAEDDAREAPHITAITSAKTCNTWDRQITDALLNDLHCLGKIMFLVCMKKTSLCFRV